jgi:hypothetical protein
VVGMLHDDHINVRCEVAQCTIIKFLDLSSLVIRVSHCPEI